MRITALAGGIGGARFLTGLLEHLRTVRPDGAGGTTDEVVVIGNTGDDLWVHGLRVCPDLDTVMYTLGGGISAERGWGRQGETFTVKDELAAYEVQPDWFGLGDKDIATHLVRLQLLNAGYPLSAITEALCARWRPGVRLLPMTDDRAETHVVVDDPDGGRDPRGEPLRRAIHFQEWWVRWRASLPAHGFTMVGIDESRPAPGVLDAVAGADMLLLPPSNPVVSIGTILSVPGIRDAVRTTAAPVVGLSPIVRGAPVRGMADACLSAIGVETRAAAVARHYGARGNGDGILDGWLVDSSDAGDVPDVEAAGIRCRATPLLMSDVPATARMAAAALELAEEIRA